MIEHAGKIFVHPSANQSSVSAFQLEVASFVKSLDVSLRVSDRNTIDKELDIYIPDYNLAIECNGAFWHSELSGGKNRDYHILKTEKCKELGIHLVHIWDYEWENHKGLIQSRIKSLLFKNSRIPARKCTVREITSRRASEFLKLTHIQGPRPASCSLGLFFNEELVAVMTFCRSRYQKDIEWELLRYSTSRNTNIVGGAGKLFSAFLKKKKPQSVISYSDRMRNRGGVYTSIGFEYSHSTAPAYYYTKDYRTFENRVAYQKHKLDEKLQSFDATLTEWENMQLNGYDRVWDCGNDVFVWFAKDHKNDK